MRNVILFIITVFILSNCKKPNAPDCFQPLGELMDFPIEIDSTITKILINDDVKVILQNTSETQSSFLRCPEYLESDFSLGIKDNLLTLNNNNTCNWVRKQAEITLYIYSNNISEIENRGVKGADLVNFNTVSFKFNQWESLATNHLDVNTDSLEVNLHVLSGEAIISGSSDYAQLYANGAAAILDDGFTCQTAFVNNSSQKDIYISAEDFLYAFILNDGNILYNNNNADVNISIEGNGNVIFTDF